MGLPDIARDSIYLSASSFTTKRAALFSINHDAKNIALEELLVVFNQCHHEVVFVVGIFCLEENILYHTARNRSNYIQQNLTCNQ